MIRAAKLAAVQVKDSRLRRLQYQTCQLQVATLIAHHMCHFFLGFISGTDCGSILSSGRRAITGTDLVQDAGWVWEQAVFGGSLVFFSNEESCRPGRDQVTGAYVVTQNLTVYEILPKCIKAIAAYREFETGAQLVYIVVADHACVQGFKQAFPLSVTGPVHHLTRSIHTQEDHHRSKLLDSMFQGRSRLRLASAAMMEDAKGSPRYSFRGADFKALMRISRYPELAPVANEMPGYVLVK